MFEADGLVAGSSPSAVASPPLLAPHRLALHPFRSACELRRRRSHHQTAASNAPCLPSISPCENCVHTNRARTRIRLVLLPVLCRTAHGTEQHPRVMTTMTPLCFEPFPLSFLALRGCQAPSNPLASLSLQASRCLHTLPLSLHPVKTVKLCKLLFSSFPLLQTLSPT